MGNFLTYMMETLRHQPEPRDTEIDHNTCVCCGSVNVTEHEKSDAEESDGEHENALCR